MNKLITISISIFIFCIGCEFNNDIWEDFDEVEKTIAEDFIEIKGNILTVNFSETMNTSLGLIKIRDFYSSETKIYINFSSSNTVPFTWVGNILSIDISSLASPGDYSIELKNFITANGDIFPLSNENFSI